MRQGADKNIEASGFGASTNTLTGQIRYSENAFTSYDNLKMAYIKESFHHNQWKKGTLSSQPDELIPNGKWYPEETKGFIYAYKNQGLFPNYTGNISSAIQSYQMRTLTLATSQWYTPKWWHFIYKIPRRW